MKDSKGNLIQVTIFESYLSKYLIENPEYFESIYQRIFSAIQEIELFNKNNRFFDRTLFSILSLLQDKYPGYNDINSLKDKFDLMPSNYFIKLFCDYILNKTQFHLMLPYSQRDCGVASLSALCKQTLFKDAKGFNKIHTHLRIPALFDENKRGATILNSKTVKTRKLGITTLENTPENLLLYFQKKYEPSQYIYQPNRDSNVGKWLSLHNLPVISGTSGGACDSLSWLFSIMDFSHKEIKLLLVSFAAALIAEGHHSYFEIMILLDRFGYKIKSAKNLFELYEQTLPESIVRSSSYATFKHSSEMTVLINELSAIDEALGDVTATLSYC